jgi:hypothetical protein
MAPLHLPQGRCTGGRQPLGQKGAPADPAALAATVASGRPGGGIGRIRCALQRRQSDGPMVHPNRAFSVAHLADLGSGYPECPIEPYHGGAIKPGERPFDGKVNPVGGGWPKKNWPAFTPWPPSGACRAYGGHRNLRRRPFAAFAVGGNRPLVHGEDDPPVGFRKPETG